MNTYIQIGANIGNDLFQRTIENLPDKARIIIVEPNTLVHPTLENNYINLQKIHDITFLQCAISLKSGNDILYKPSSSSEHFSLLNRPCWETEEIYYPIKKEVIKTLSFMDLCNKFNITKIEYLFMDTEGADYEILNSIDLSQINIERIYFEGGKEEICDLNCKYKSGPKFLNEVLKPKFKNYKWEFYIESNGVQNYKLTKSFTV